MDDTYKTQSHGLIELNHTQFVQAPETHMQQLSNKWLEFVVATDTTDDSQIKNLSEGLSQFGLSEQRAFCKLNNSLKHPIEKLIRDTQGGGKVTQLLRELQVIVLKIKPPKRSYWGDFVNMFKLLFSLKESAWHIWLEDYPIYKQQIQKVTELLESHKKQLKRDNTLWLSNQNELNNNMRMLENSFDLICYLENKVSHEVLHNQEVSTEIKQLLMEELLPEMQQRLIEIQQQLLIARQTVMTMDLFIGQNKSQINAIDQTVFTTASAIEVTAGIFMLKQAGHSNNLEKSTIKTVDAQRLKQARNLIDQVLSDMEKVKITPEHVKSSTASIKD